MRQVIFSPLSALEVDQLLTGFEPFEKNPHIAVGVSGGPDSLALTLLLAQWAQRQQGTLTALTVDHKLRPESTQEAEWVHAELSRYGINHHILTWEGPKPQAGLQEKAREARLDLLVNWCKTRSVLHLFLGHHLADQQETFLMRQARGSAPAGLLGMAPLSLTPSVRILRPFLTIHPGRLKATLTHYNQAFIEDPSNQNLRFERVRWRQENLKRFPGELLDQYPEITLITEHTEQQFLSILPNFRLSPAGFAALPLHHLSALEPTVLKEFFKRILTTLSGKIYGPQQKAIDHLYLKILNNEFNHTLHGCQLLRHQNWLWLGREPRAAEGPVWVAPHTSLTWDRRFNVLNHSTAPYLIRLAGAHVSAHSRLSLTPPGLPRKLRETLLSVWSPEGELICVLDGSQETWHKLESCKLSIHFQPPKTLCRWGLSN